MYKLTIASNYTDDLYTQDLYASLGKYSNWKLVSVEYAYKRAGMYWTIEMCWLTSSGEFKTFKQMSKEYLELV